jgi:NTP pyrophosphatase (non-canonical NTP hydrolase)
LLSFSKEVDWQKWYLKNMNRIYKINAGLRKVFPDSDKPFQVMTRLLEECGELAAEINHFEGSGVKRQKHGEPNVTKLAKEVQDVIRCALQIATCYGIEEALDASITLSNDKMVAEGLIPE